MFQKVDGGRRWPVIFKIDNNRSNVIEMRKSFVTDEFRIFVKGTKDDKRQPIQQSLQFDQIVPQRRIGKPFVQEIEVYGFVSKDKK